MTKRTKKTAPAITDKPAKATEGTKSAAPRPETKRKPSPRRPKKHPASVQQPPKQEPAPEQPVTMAQHLGEYRKAYTKSKTASGDTSAHCGDEVAAVLAGLEPDKVVSLASALLGLDLADRYRSLNPGQRRMNAGNRLRAAVKAGTVTVEKLQASV